MKLEVQSCKVYNNKYMIALTQITNTKIFAFVAVHHCKIINSWNAKFQDTFEIRKQSFISAFSICMIVPYNGIGTMESLKTLWSLFEEEEKKIGYKVNVKNHTPS